MAPQDAELIDDVGYGKPPKHTRFRKGVSGNPGGRPKGRRNLASVLDRTLREKVVINENGVRKTVTKLEAAIKQLINQAPSGDKAAIRQLTALAGSTPAVEEPQQVQPDDNDQKIVQNLLERFKQSEKRNDHENR